MGNTVKIITELPVKGHYDLIVAGGGVAGVAAAITAKRRGLSVLLIEKSNILGGLGTLGLINLFVPMCNGRGKQIIFGLAEEWLRKATLYGYDTIRPKWKDGEPKEPTLERYATRYSPYIFALQMTEMIQNEKVDILFDCIVTEPVMEGNRCKGLVTESKSGREYYEADMVIDTTGDADILRRSGVPTVKGKNFFTYIGKGITLESCQRAVDTKNIFNVYTRLTGGDINLYGDNQPEDIPLWSGTTVEDVTDYLVTNQLTMLEKIKKDDRLSRDIAMIPMMPDFRTTCRLDGDYALREEDRFKHFEDSVCAINDFERRDFLYEVPLRCITKRGFPNLLTAGRSASAVGYGWDVLRVIPPAILTGQAAAETAALAIEAKCAVSDVDIKVLQQRLEHDDNIMIHFPDSLIPEDPDKITDGHEEDHI